MPGIPLSQLQEWLEFFRLWRSPSCREARSCLVNCVTTAELGVAGDWRGIGRCLDCCRCLLCLLHEKNPVDVWNLGNAFCPDGSEFCCPSSGKEEANS